MQRQPWGVVHMGSRVPHLLCGVPTPFTGGLLTPPPISAWKPSRVEKGASFSNIHIKYERASKHHHKQCFKAKSVLLKITRPFQLPQKASSRLQRETSSPLQVSSHLPSCFSQDLTQADQDYHKLL